MAIQIVGNGGVVAEVDGTTHRSQRVSSRPGEALGDYRIGVATGLVAGALAAAAQIAQFKWTDASKLAVIKFVKVETQVATPYAAGVTEIGLDMRVIRPTYTGGGGGTTLTLTGNNAKMRTSQATSLAVINVSTTAALTLVSATLDAHPVAAGVGDLQRTNPAAATEEARPNIPTLLFKPDLSAESPLILALNEGFVISNRTALPATGTSIFTIEIAWSEVTTF